MYCGICEIGLLIGGQELYILRIIDLLETHLDNHNPHMFLQLLVSQGPQVAVKMGRLYTTSLVISGD